MRRFYGFLLFLGSVVAGWGTTLVPPTFDELVGDSELVFRGRVVATKSGWSGAGASRRVATWVTFAVDRVLRGEAADHLTLEFAGGEVDGKRVELADWPQFSVGDRGVYFVENRRARLCPLRGVRHGSYRVVSDGNTGKEHVVRDDFSPLRFSAEVGRPLAAGRLALVGEAGSAGLVLADFEGLVEARSKQLPVPERARR